MIANQFRCTSKSVDLYVGTSKSLRAVAKTASCKQVVVKGDIVCHRRSPRFYIAGSVIISSSKLCLCNGHGSEETRSLVPNCLQTRPIAWSVSMAAKALYPYTSIEVLFTQSLLIAQFANVHCVACLPVNLRISLSSCTLLVLPPELE